MAVSWRWYRRPFPGAGSNTLWRPMQLAPSSFGRSVKIAKSRLSEIERGESTLDSISEIVALATALGIAPSELTRLPVPAPANGHTDSTIEAVRLTLDAIEVDLPAGLVLPVAVLRDRVTQIHQQARACQFVAVAAALPALIRDLHATLSTGSDHVELLVLAVHLHVHVHVTRMWLGQAGAPADLRRRVVFLARRLAHEHGAVATVGVAAFGVADALAGGGAFELVFRRDLPWVHRRGHRDRAVSPRRARAYDRWRDAEGNHVPVGARVEQTGTDARMGALRSRLGQQGEVTSRGTTRLRVRFEGEDQPVTIRPHLVWVIPR